MSHFHGNGYKSCNFFPYNIWPSHSFSTRLIYLIGSFSNHWLYWNQQEKRPVDPESVVNQSTALILPENLKVTRDLGEGQYGVVQLGLWDPKNGTNPVIIFMFNDCIEWWMNDWLADSEWWTDWLADQMMDWQTDRLTTDQLTDWLTNQLTDWLTGSLTDSLTHSPTNFSLFLLNSCSYQFLRCKLSPF